MVKKNVSRPSSVCVRNNMYHKSETISSQNQRNMLRFSHQERCVRISCMYVRCWRHPSCPLWRTAVKKSSSHWNETTTINSSSVVVVSLGGLIIDGGQSYVLSKIKTGVFLQNAQKTETDRKTKWKIMTKNTDWQRKSVLFYGGVSISHLQLCELKSWMCSTKMQNKLEQLRTSPQHQRHVWEQCLRRVHHHPPQPTSRPWPAGVWGKKWCRSDLGATGVRWKRTRSSECSREDPQLCGLALEE